MNQPKLTWKFLTLGQEVSGDEIDFFPLFNLHLNTDISAHEVVRITAKGWDKNYGIELPENTFVDLVTSGVPLSQLTRYCLPTEKGMELNLSVTYWKDGKETDVDGTVIFGKESGNRRSFVKDNVLYSRTSIEADKDVFVQDGVEKVHGLPFKRFKAYEKVRVLTENGFETLLPTVSTPSEALELELTVEAFADDDTYMRVSGNKPFLLSVGDNTSFGESKKVHVIKLSDCEIAFLDSESKVLVPELYAVSGEGNNQKVQHVGRHYVPLKELKLIHSPLESSYNIIHVEETSGEDLVYLDLGELNKYNPLITGCRLSRDVQGSQSAVPIEVNVDVIGYNDRLYGVVKKGVFLPLEGKGWLLSSSKVSGYVELVNSLSGKPFNYSTLTDTFAVSTSTIKQKDLWNSGTAVLLERDNGLRIFTSRPQMAFIETVYGEEAFESSSRLNAGWNWIPLPREKDGILLESANINGLIFNFVEADKLVAVTNYGKYFVNGTEIALGDGIVAEGFSTLKLPCNFPLLVSGATDIRVPLHSVEPDLKVEEGVELPIPVKTVTSVPIHRGNKRIIPVVSEMPLGADNFRLAVNGKEIDFSVVEKGTTYLVEYEEQYPNSEVELLVSSAGYRSFKYSHKSEKLDLTSLSSDVEDDKVVVRVPKYKPVFCDKPSSVIVGDAVYLERLSEDYEAHTYWVKEQSLAGSNAQATHYMIKVEKKG